MRHSGTGNVPSKRHLKIAIAAVVAVVCVWLFWWWAAVGYPTQEQICDPPPADYDCSSYSIVVYLILAALDKLNFYGAVITAIATAIIAWFTYTLRAAALKSADLTQQSIDLARDDFSATHRPWIQITTVSNSNGLWWSGDNAFTGLNVFCRNTGSSPAQRVSVAAKFFPFLPNVAILKELEILKEFHRIEPASRQLEHTMFPDPDDTLIERILMISSAEIAALKDGYGDPAKEMIPVIIGAIQYYFPFGPQIPHYTPFVRFLWHKKDGVEGTFKLDGARIPTSEIVLKSHIAAGDAS